MNLVHHVFQDGNGTGEQESRARGSQGGHTTVECQSFGPVRTFGTQ